MKSKGVIYYNRGTKCIIRLLVSLASLRKHWDGEVSVIYSGDQQEWFVKALEKFNAKVVVMPFRKGEGSLVLKASLWRYSPYDLTMFMDADTIVLNPIDEYFDYIEEHDFVTGNFANWKSTGGTISKRIKSWEAACPELIQDAIGFGPAVNTGVDGWKKDATLLKAWEELTIKGYKLNCTRRIVDEVACQLLLPQHKCYVADTRWGESIKFGKYNKETVIIHFHGNKHAGDRPQNALWKAQYNELIDIHGITEIKKNNFGDRALKGYTGTIKKNLTIVSAVNKKYFNKFKSKFPKWQVTEGLMEHPYIIFAHDDCLEEARSFLSKWNNVKIIPWRFPKAEGNVREEMLSAFVFGTAEHVKTKYWMKLDGDTTPKSHLVEIPDFAFNSVITAPKWHYTKCKGDPNYDIEDPDKNKHWLNRLDDWADSLPDFAKTKRLFKDNIEGRRHGHRRICSFAEVEKTAWTTHLADMCMRTGGRLPVPSQDTTTWYAAKRLGRKISEWNFRRDLNP